MTQDALKRYDIGERVTSWPATTWNTIVDAISGPIQPVPFEYDDADSPLVNSSRVLLKNTTTETVKKGGVLQLLGSVVTPSIDRSTHAPIVNGGAPTNTLYAIPEHDIEAGSIGACTLQGFTWARVDITSTTHGFATYVSGSTANLTSASYDTRARIVSQESGTGVKWCLIELRQTDYMPIQKAVVSGANITAGGSGSVEIYSNGVGTTETITAYLNWMNGGEDISVGKEVLIAYFANENKWVIIAAECETPGLGPVDGRITAAGAPNNNQTNGTSISTRSVVEVTSNESGAAVVLPAVTFESQVWIKCIGPYSCQVFPAVADKIDGGTVNASVTLAPGESALFFGVDPTEWLTMPLMTDYNLEVARGTISGQTSVNKFGRTTNADSAVATDVWDRANATDTQAIWVAPTAARTHQITSTSASDDGDPAGVGARTIQVYGLTSWSTAEVSETITMNGVANVATANQYVIIHRMKVLTKGATNVNVGKITATCDVDGTITAQINAGEGQTQMAIYGVPSTQTAYMTRYYSGFNRAGITGATDVSLLMNPEPGSELINFVTKSTNSISSSGTSSISHEFRPYDVFPGPCILKVQVTSDTNNMDISAGFDLILVDN